MNAYLGIPFAIITVKKFWAFQKQNWLFTLTNRVISLCIIISVVTILINWKTLPPLIPLWKSRPWGGDELAKPIVLFLLPSVSILWHICNIILSGTLVKEHRIFSQILYLSSLFVGVFSCIEVVTIIYLVI
jgi:hypothetical protein